MVKYFENTDNTLVICDSGAQYSHDPGAAGRRGTTYH